MRTPFRGAETVLRLGGGYTVTLFNDAVATASTVCIYF